MILGNWFLDDGFPLAGPGPSTPNSSGAPVGMCAQSGKDSVAPAPSVSLYSSGKLSLFML
jgi:hypothetical protein